MKNTLQVEAWLFDLAINQDLSADTVSTTIRREDMEVYKMISKIIEQKAQQLKDQWEKAFGPVARNYMQMCNKELKLRGDLQAELHQLTTTDPRDIREIVRHVQVLNDQDRETWMGPGQPPYIVDAIELLEASTEDLTQFAHFRAVLDELYPPAKHDDDDVAPEQAATDAA